MRVKPNILFVRRKHLNSNDIQNVLGRKVKIKKDRNACFIILPEGDCFNETECVAIARRLGMVFNGKWIF